MSTITSIAGSDVVAGSRTTINTNFSNLNTDKVEGQSSSVDSEVALFSGTGGKTIKRASATGIAKLTSGVLSAITPASGIETFLATPSSANLATAVTDETGSGALVFGTSPTLTTPVINTPIIKTWDGWNTVSDSWSYASATTITVPSGAASLYSVGDKIKLTQTTVKYFVVIAVADTLLTVTGGSDYTVANAAISSIFVSHVANPVGFPHRFNYTVTGPTNTTLTGRFSVHGRTCFVEIRGAVTGTPDFSTMPLLPISVSSSYLVASSNDYTPAGVGGYLDNGTANKTIGIVPHLNASATTVRLVSQATSAIVTSSVPITWANGDVWWVKFDYEI